MALYKDLKVWTFEDKTRIALDNSALVSTGAKVHYGATGDTLLSLALLYYGAHKDWHFIGEANTILDPYEDLFGKTLIIPDNGK